MAFSLSHYSESLLRDVRKNTNNGGLSYQQLAHELERTADLAARITTTFWLSGKSVRNIRSNIKALCNEYEKRLGMLRVGALVTEVTADDLHAAIHVLDYLRGHSPSETSMYMWRVHQRPLRTKLSSNSYASELRNNIRRSTRSAASLARKFQLKAASMQLHRPSLRVPSFKEIQQLADENRHVIH